MIEVDCVNCNGAGVVETADGPVPCINCGGSGVRGLRGAEDHVFDRDDESGLVDGELVIVMAIDGDRAFHETGLKGVWDGDQFLLPFHDEMTAEEVARIVAQAIRNAGQSA